MSDILIVGGGIIGMLTARELSLAGMSVTIVDQSEAGRESSWAGGGILSPLYPWRYPASVSVLVEWSQRVYPELVADIYSETGLDAELIQNGLLIFDYEQNTVLEWADKRQVAVEIIDNQKILELEPELSPELVHQGKAVWMPDVQQVRNPRFMKAIKKYLLKQGVKFTEHVTVTGFVKKEGKVLGITTSVGDIFADNVLVAGGAWSAKLLKNINISINVAPVKGQMILFKTEPNKIKRILLSQDRYVIPRRDGRVLVGSTLEHTEFQKTVTAEAKEELIKEAVRMIPFLKNVEVEHHWAGLRPGSKNGIPYICAAPNLQGVYLNSGHYRNGVVLGPASARLAADLILQQQPILSPKAYQIERDEYKPVV